MLVINFVDAENRNRSLKILQRQHGVRLAALFGDPLLGSRNHPPDARHGPIGQTDSGDRIVKPVLLENWGVRSEWMTRHVKAQQLFFCCEQFVLWPLRKM